MANLSYNFSGNWEDVYRVLRNFPTEVILKRIGREAIELQKDIKNSEVSGTKWIEYKAFNTKKRKYENQKSIITTWNLIDTAYYAVIASNDYRGNPEISDTEFYVVVDAVSGYTQRKEESVLDSIEPGSKEAFMRLWGFAGEQFKAQATQKIFNNTGRELYILLESSKRIPEKEIDVPAVVKAETGYDWGTVICTLFLAWVYFSQNCVYSDNALASLNTTILSKSDFRKIIDRYSIDYSEIRNSKLGRQVFYTKPFIITQKKELLGISPYLNLCVYEHCILWIAREHYLKKNSQAFTDYFGLCFEKYFEELLESTLQRKEYVKIPESNGLSADWRLEIDGFHFLVEQKSTIMRLDIKQQETNIGSIKEFARRVIVKAITQLDSTEKDFSDEQYIKIVLLYDDYLMPAIMNQVFEMDECEVENDGRYWLVTIEEMEALLSLCNGQRDIFCAVVKEKEHRELTHSNLGSSLLQILTEKGVKDNAYMKQKKIMYYRDYAEEQAKKMLKQ